jgi:hypothetical protein
MRAERTPSSRRSTRGSPRRPTTCCCGRRHRPQGPGLRVDSGTPPRLEVEGYNVNDLVVHQQDLEAS